MGGKWRFSLRAVANAREMTSARIGFRRNVMSLRHVIEIRGKSDTFQLAHTIHKLQKVPIPTSTIQPTVPKTPTAPRR